MAYRHFVLQVIWLLAAMVSPLCHAVTYVQPTSVTQYVVYAGKTGSTGAFVVITPAVSGLEGCSAGGGTRLWIDFSSTTLPDGKVLYATMMAGALAGKTLAFDVDGCDPIQNLPIVFRVDVFP